MRIVLGEFLMLVVVVLDELDLADALERAVPVDLGEDADLESPIRRNAVGSR